MEISFGYEFSSDLIFEAIEEKDLLDIVLYVSTLLSLMLMLI